MNFYYRVPKNYDPQAKHKYRVLVYFGGRNAKGEHQVSNHTSFAKWADLHGIFIVSMGFRDDDYWYPQKWSGKALVRALKIISKMYNIKRTRLLYYGYSAGSQCSNLFPAAYPKQTVAWVSHGCGVYHEPTKAMRKVAGLVTCGDADTDRYIISRRFVSACREKNINVIFKSFPNHPHDVPPGSLKLARAFLLYHHLLNLDDLKLDNPPEPNEKYAYVGDDVDGVYYKPDAFELHFVDQRDKVYLPSYEIASAWGRYYSKQEELKILRTIFQKTYNATLGNQNNFQSINKFLSCHNVCLSWLPHEQVKTSETGEK